MSDFPTLQPTTTFSSSHSMRENYSKHGVDNYYANVAETYRNPHAAGVRNVVGGWMDLWHSRLDQHDHDDVQEWTVLDMAAGSGEVTEALDGWLENKRKRKENQRVNGGRMVNPRRPLPMNLKTIDGTSPSRTQPQPPSSPPSSPSSSFTVRLNITATDPYTSPAFRSRTGRPCLPLSFSDISQGLLPDSPAAYTHVVCSFALHLVADPSELFSLLWELSTRATWLLVVSPGKKPDVKEGWGWARWDVSRWKAAATAEGEGSEIVAERCRGRVYRSVNYFGR
ncbi:hypothetical protein HKX48_005500 [Thoreauomyces humboldtii]|nr:hypothetical protein HKX48_005500 [Thoreauomyces humboldtii]